MTTVYLNSANDITEKESTPDELRGGCVAALGFFDGVHVAHRALISAAKARADKEGLPLAVFTFSSGGAIKGGAQRLYSDEDKLALLEECAVDVSVVADFSAFRETGSKDFISKLLIGYMHTRVAFCGYNFRFGKGACGTPEELSRIMSEHGKECEILEMQRLGEEEISTTRIRALLSEGDAVNAAKLLGKPYFIKGKVEHGLGLGSELGIPTVNTSLNSKALLRGGVYASLVMIDRKRYFSLTNIGSCPTFGKRDEHAETYILGYSGNLYGEELRIYLLKHLRDEMRFSDKDELLKQIKLDTESALALGKEIKWQEIGLSLQ